MSKWSVLLLSLALLVLAACNLNSQDSTSVYPTGASESKSNAGTPESISPTPESASTLDPSPITGPERLSLPAPTPETKSLQLLVRGTPLVTVGLFVACALREDGTPDCWNISKEVGPISPELPALELPLVPPPDGESFVSISSGVYQICGLQADGTPICWMSISDPSLASMASPPDGEVFASVDSRTCYSCGLRPDGTPLCWAQFFDEFICQFELVNPPAEEKFIELSGNDGFSCGLRHDGSFICYADVQVPIAELGKVPQMPEGERFVAISHGNWSFCAIRQSGNPACWYFNVVADGWVQADDADVGSIVSISAGAFHSCGLRENGAPVCWWIKGEFDANSWPLEDERFVAIASADFYSCGLRADGSHLCWVVTLPA